MNYLVDMNSDITGVGPGGLGSFTLGDAQALPPSQINADKEGV